MSSITNIDCLPGLRDNPRMAGVVQIPPTLSQYCGGRTELPVTAGDVRTALAELERSYPSLYRNLCDETGAVRRHLNVFVNAAHMRDLRGLDTPLAQGDVMTILAAVSGG
jgi:molybdopterin synthase sulfur carrier subunit